MELILVIICGVLMALYKYFDWDKDVERFYYETDQKRYYILKLSVYTIWLAFIINVRHIIMNIVKKHFWKRFFNKKLA